MVISVAGFCALYMLSYLVMTLALTASGVDILTAFSAVAAAMDEANDRFGEFAVTFASVMEAEEKGSHVISPAWRPDASRWRG